MEAISTSVTTILTGLVVSIGRYLPQFLAGLILLLIGLAVAAILKEVVLRALSFLRVEDWFGSVTGWFKSVKSTGINRGRAWSNLLAELVRWTIVILFLVPAAEAWGLPRVTDLLNQFLLYVPNVFVAIVIGFVGLVVANLVADIVQHSSHSLGGSSSSLLSTVARYALVLFTALVVLNQLGIAADLVRILFTGIVAMLAVSGGIAFGLGGQGVARDFLEDLRKRVGK